MKRIFEILVSTVCLSICYEVNAQNDVYLVSDPQNAKWSYIEMDSKGKHVLTIYYSIDSIEGNGVKDGEFMVDLSAGLEYNMFEGELDNLVHNTIMEKYPDLSEEQKKDLLEKTKAEFVKTSGEIRGIPRYPKVGKLPDYEFHSKVSIMSMNVSGEDRRIVGTERILTNAGSFDCFILEETITTKSMMMKDLEKIKSWYAYGIGLVKEITYDKNGKLISTMILNEVNW